MRARDQSSGVAGVIKVSRDQAKLGNASCIEFMVVEDFPNFPNKDEATLCGIYAFRDHVLDHYGSSQSRFPGGRPIKEAFDDACRDAEEKGFSAIWITDLYQQFDVEPWVRQGLIDDLDDHS
jgi:hypothetical protein